ncbi:toxin co-regulated pilus biosynthesis Q family protein [Telmatospirillum sp.]|uniref:toxin co-regulated pilus biosynthesis Q family protein n=1 Tax=Telmatospirillum sp. TaxID=2079197 RepID=UPI00284308C0|nr:toxin co-regulated pilus biosynthesis Q family protein [Telmatospirillum sp.]MDR3438181.1 toxin co-regulated pilus biosynthesis Q family protein [Telmatospirillum sp.]
MTNRKTGEPGPMATDLMLVTGLMLGCLLATPAVAQSTAFTQAGTGDETNELVLGFESRSNRLSPFETGRLDRLAGRLTLQGDYRLFLLVPSPADPASRHFVDARMNVVEEELSKRGLAAETVHVPRSVQDGSTVILKISPKDLPRTPVEVLPAPAPSPSPIGTTLPVVETPVPVQVEQAPVPLVPDSHGEGTAAATVPVGSVAPDPVAVVPFSKVTADEDASPRPGDTPATADEMWSATVGQSLQTVLRSWGERAGWTVVWQSDREYPVDAPVTFFGDFTTVAGQLLEGFVTAVPAPFAHFYKGNRVLLILSGEGR